MGNVQNMYIPHSVLRENAYFMKEPTPKSRAIFQIKENMVKKCSFYSFLSEKWLINDFFSSKRYAFLKNR